MRASRRHVAEANAQLILPTGIPPSWRVCALGDVVRLQPGYAFKSAWFVKEGVRLLRGTNIEPGGTRWQDVACLSPELAERFAPFRLNIGDLVIAMDRPIISSGLKIATIQQDDLPCLLLQRVGRFQCTAAIEREFLRQYLRSTLFIQHIDSQATGTQLPHVSGTDIETAPLVVPPLNEQRRIVAKLEALQSRSRRAREALDAVPPLLEKLRQAILAAAFRGDLTKDWRAQNPNPEPAEALLVRIRTERRKKWEASELAKLKAKGKPPTNDAWKAKYKEPDPVDTTGLPELPEGWCWASLDELLFSIESGRSPRAEGRPAGPGEFGVLKVSAVSWGTFDASENKALLDGEQIDDTPTVRAGDLIISRANTVQLVGAVAIAEADYPNLMLSDKTLRLVPASSLVSVRLLLYALRSRIVRSLFEADATGTSDSMRNLSQDKILSAPIPLAPEEELVLLVNTLESELGRLSVVLDSVDDHKRLLDRLEASFLAKAFRGELVPQQPNDEPADAMLARLKAEAPAESFGNRTRRVRAAE